MDLLYGKPVVEKLKQELKTKIEALSRKPKLVILLNKEDESSRGYARALIKNGTNLSIDVEVCEMPQEEEAYCSKIISLNENDLVDGILLTRPLSKQINEKKIVALIDKNKDVDALHSDHLGKLYSGKEDLVPSTALAIVKLLEFYQIPLQGKKVLVVGRSISVGKPSAALLINRDATVTIAHSKTVNLKEELKNADIVIAALGKPEFLKTSDMKEDVVVIDAGIHYLEDKIVGDVCIDKQVKAVSPVPGGVGVITTTCLLHNVYYYALKKERENGTK